MGFRVAEKLGAPAPISPDIKTGLSRLGYYPPGHITEGFDLLVNPAFVVVFPFLLVLLVVFSAY